ncbi:MAG: sensor histidine kinase [Desulfurivibrionaceae bacterium]|jgi:signal transduction histidine kinase|nr:ATP-binding protein [Desulfurivibrionaceae bacterium]
MNFPDLLWLKKKIRLPRGYRLKLFLTFLGVLVLCGTGLIVLFGQIQRQTLLEETYNKGNFVSSMLARNLETPLFFMNTEQINANVEAIFGATDLVAVFIYDKEGKRIFSRFAPQAEGAASRFEEMGGLGQIMKEHLASGGDEPNPHWRQEHYFVFCKRVITAGQSSDQTSLYFDTGKVEQRQVTDLGGVQIVFSHAQYTRGMKRIIRHALLLFLSFLPISLFTAVMLARDVVRPLRTLVEALRLRLGKTEEEEEETKTTDELGQLDDRMKQLVTRLDQSFAVIAQMNEGLEEKVAARTAELTKAMQELKEAQTQLVQSEKMGAVGQLVAGVAHEVNNTTNFITGALPPLGKRLGELRRILDGYAEQCCPDASRVAELMQSIDLLMGNVREGARRTSKIVTDLKNFSRPDNDLARPIDINHCLESTLALALPEYRHKLEVVREFTEGLPKVSGSQGQLCQVFMNLIINAVHAQPDKGSLLVRTFSAEDGVHVVFADKGTGIPKDIQKRIFEPFFTTKEVGKGTGLGLSVSFGIISRHRGRILVRSELGQGAEFEVILPAGQEPIALQHEENER